MKTSLLIPIVALICLTQATPYANAAPPSIMPALPESPGPSPDQVRVNDKRIDLQGASANKIKAVELLNEATGNAENGNFADAARNLEDAILYLNDSDAQLAAALHMNLGSSYDHLGKLDKALSEFEKASKLNPRELEILYNEAMVLEKLKRYDEAVANLNQYVTRQKDPKLQHEALTEIDRIKALK